MKTQNKKEGKQGAKSATVSQFVYLSVEGLRILTVSRFLLRVDVFVTRTDRLNRKHVQRNNSEIHEKREAEKQKRFN